MKDDSTSQAEKIVDDYGLAFEPDWFEGQREDLINRIAAALREAGEENRRLRAIMPHMDNHHIKPDEVCAACNHLVDFHFRNVLGAVRCVVTENRTGWIAYTHYCDCKNYASPSQERKKLERARIESERNELISKIIEKTDAQCQECIGRALLLR